VKSKIRKVPKISIDGGIFIHECKLSQFVSVNATVVKYLTITKVAVERYGASVTKLSRIS
jgi:hypothetical protein